MGACEEVYKVSAIVPATDLSAGLFQTVGSAAKWAFDHVDAEEFPIWSQLPREPMVWFERFSEFLMMESHERGILKICNRIRLRDHLPPIAMLPHEWKLYSAAWRWKDRASAFDTFQKMEEERDMERRKKQSKQRRLAILSNLEDKLSLSLEAFNPDEDAFRLSEVVTGIKVLGQESRAELDDGPVKRSEIKITTMADLLRDAEREQYGQVVEGEFRDV